MSDQSQTLADTLAAMAEGAGPAGPGRDPLAVPLSALPLPPAELVDDLDNATPAAAASRPAAEVATLDFVGDAPPERTFTLTYPFRWNGVRYDAITVRALRTGSLGDVYAEAARAGRRVELMDLYGAMCGLPAAVLRALPAVDGDPIIDQAWDFLPPSARPAAG
ncbi:hypothetical protein ACQVP2_35200 [Methylobacterium aquaticum]|uniref:hypothetical protein n=1 Tax=Methylobacterium aquaticum TaxID=270351 RepID=UPI003D17E502